MSTKLKYISFLCFFIVALATVLSTTTKYKCCAPDQWEGQATMDFNQIPYLIHANLTADVAYDYTNSIIFVNASGIFDAEQRSILYIEDYKNHIEYEVDYDRNCTITDISGTDITRQCIQDNDTLLYSGRVGKGIVTDTYNTSLNDQFNNVKATVQRGTCYPVHLAYIIKNILALMSVDVYNITLGIKDRKIFEKPPQCKKSTIKHKKKKEDHQFKSIMRDVRRILLGRMKS